MWKGVTGSLGPWGGGGIAGMVVGSQWRSWAARVYRAAVMMWWACPSRTMWRSVPKSFGRWAAGWTVMWARARWWAFFPPSGACVRLSPGMCWCWCFGGGGPRARDSTQWRGMACSLDLLGRMYMPGSPGTVPRYIMPVMVGDGSGWRRGEVHGLEQGGSWCSHRQWSMPYGVTCTAKGPTARWSLWGWMLWRRATARVWERPSLIHKASARDAAGFRQSVVMPVIVRLWVVSDTLAWGGADAGDGVVVVEGAGLTPRIVSVLGLLGGGVHTCVFGLLVGAVCCVEGGGPGGGVVEGGMWEVPPCCPCVQGGRGGPFRLYGVSLVVSATGDEDVGGRQLIHLCGVGEVAGEGDLGGVVLAGGGVGDDVVGRPFVLGGLFRRV